MIAPIVIPIVDSVRLVKSQHNRNANAKKIKMDKTQYL